jgi:dodecin
MSIARVVELTATSEQSFEDAMRRGIARATATLRNVKSAWIKEQEVRIRDGEIADFKVNMLVTFVLDADDDESEMLEEQVRPAGRSSKRGGRRASR